MWWETNTLYCLLFMKLTFQDHWKFLYNVLGFAHNFSIQQICLVSGLPVLINKNKKYRISTQTVLVIMPFTHLFVRAFLCPKKMESHCAIWSCWLVDLIKASFYSSDLFIHDMYSIWWPHELNIRLETSIYRG